MYLRSRDLKIDFDRQNMSNKKNRTEIRFLKDII